LSGKVEVIEGKVSRGTIDNVNTVSRWHPLYVCGSRDEAFVTAIDGRGPGLSMASHDLVEKLQNRERL
jgi:hypothetical protein